MEITGYYGGEYHKENSRKFINIQSKQAFKSVGYIPLTSRIEKTLTARNFKCEGEALYLVSQKNEGEICKFHLYDRPYYNAHRNKLPKKRIYLTFLTSNWGLHLPDEVIEKTRRAKSVEITSSKNEGYLEIRFV
ncbi:MAG: hypothetical protein KKE23_02805 [Nanoarchaeota archaeon]|nr:hypothetical protein [Nanoarchaeota archaeon]